jgi:hypothetical protein
MTVNTLHRGGLTIETLWRGVGIADTSTPYITLKKYCLYSNGTFYA